VTRTHAQKKETKKKLNGLNVVKYVMHQEKEIVFMHVDWSHLLTKCIIGRSF